MCSKSFAVEGVEANGFKEISPILQKAIELNRSM